MAIQMILCVETKKAADTDSIYILDTIHHWYKVDEKIKISKLSCNKKRACVSNILNILDKYLDRK